MNDDAIMEAVKGYMQSRQLLIQHRCDLDNNPVWRRYDEMRNSLTADIAFIDERIANLLQLKSTKVVLNLGEGRA